MINFPALGIERYVQIGPRWVDGGVTYVLYHHLGVIPKLSSIIYSLSPGAPSSVVGRFTDTANRGATLWNMTKEKLTLTVQINVGVGEDGTWQANGYYTIHVWG